MEGGGQADPEELTRARAVLERMSASDPGDARLYYYLGIILEKQEEWEVSRYYFKKAAELDPRRFEYDLLNKEAEKESRRLPLRRYRVRLRQVYSRIGEEIVRLDDELPGLESHEMLREEIKLAKRLRGKIPLSPARYEPGPAGKDDEALLASPPASLIPPPNPLPLPEEEPGRPPVGNKRKALSDVKGELESICRLLSGKTGRNEVISTASAEESVDRESGGVFPDRRLYHEELETLDSFEKLQLRQLFDDLESRNKKNRSLAVERLGEKNLAVVNPVLLKRWLEEEVPEIQLKIVSVLVRRSYAPLVPAARKVLEDDRTDWALSAMEALYRLDWQTNLPYLQKALRSKVPAIKKRAVTYIGWIKDHSSISELIRLLRDPDSYVRKSAISALASLKVKRSVHFLVEVLMDHDQGVRSYAYKTLRKLIGETFGYDPKADFIRRKEVVDRLKIWWESVEGEFLLGAKKRVGPHLFSVKPVVSSGWDAGMEEKILSAAGMKDDGADLLELGEMIGVPWQGLAQKVEQLRKEGKLEKKERKFALVRAPERKVL
jgi:tetratricopeptide (TPR) repeat protein